MYIQVVGAGSWGLALTRVLARNGHKVRLWCRKEDDRDSLRDRRESSIYLPGVKIPESVEISMDTDPDVEMAVFAVPSHVMRHAAADHPFHKETILVSVAKGIENDTLMRMSEVMHERAPGHPVVALSGPSHAEEVGHDRPALLTAASKDASARVKVQNAFVSEVFRVYTSPDIVGVELGGSLKNVIAVAAGVCDQLDLGDNARAALMTRGLAEMSRLGVAMGADPLTFAGLSGMGDLIATCISKHSRNRALGERIASGMSPTEAASASHMVAEGMRTTRSAWALSRQYSVDMPITREVHRVLFEAADPRETITNLMLREPKSERA